MPICTSGTHLATSGAGVTLDLNLLPGFSAEIGDTFTILDGYDALTGTFAGLPDESVVEQGSFSFRIDYGAAATTLTVVAVPEPSTLLLFSTFGGVCFLVSSFRQKPGSPRPPLRPRVNRPAEQRALPPMKIGHPSVSQAVSRLAVIVAFAAGCPMAGRAAVLVNEGVPAARIVMASDAPASTREGVRELADYVERMSGARLPVVEADGGPPAGQPTTIWIGHHEDFEKFFPGVDLSLTDHEQILIVVRGDHVLVKGKDLAVGNQELQTGTLHAVYTFLEKYLGVRWLWPGELGEVVPEQSTLVLQDSVFGFTPPLQQRHIRFHPSSSEAEGYPHPGQAVIHRRDHGVSPSA